MTKVLIQWSDTHHPLDDHDMIRSALETGGDEGPLIIISAYTKRGLGPRQTPAIFKDVDHYLGHLDMYDGDVGDDRFVGLVRRSSENNYDAGLSALFQIQQVLAPGTDGIPTRRLSKREVIVQDYLVIPSDTQFATTVEIECIGDNLEEILRCCPKLESFIRLDDNDC